MEVSSDASSLESCESGTEQDWSVRRVKVCPRVRGGVSTPFPPALLGSLYSPTYWRGSRPSIWVRGFALSSLTSWRSFRLDFSHFIVHFPPLLTAPSYKRKKEFVPLAEITLTFEPRDSHDRQRNTQPAAVYCCIPRSDTTHGKPGYCATKLAGQRKFSMNLSRMRASLL